MKIRDANYNFCKYISDHFFCKYNFLFTKVEVKITHGKVLHNDVDIIVCLESFLYSHQEIFMTNLLHQLALHYVELLYFGFIYYLHCVSTVCKFLLGQNNETKRTLTQVLLVLVVLWTSA